MNVIFLTLVRISDIEERGIYQDLMRKFRDEEHQVYIVSAAERRLGQVTSLVDSHGVKILNVKTLNVQKTNIVEKGIGTLLIESQFKAAIKKHLGDVSFDLITYSTPPITFTNVVKYLKRKNPKAISYLQLKDIFPQNAVDIGMFGEKSIFNWYFRKKERALYKASDYIGCMSPANVEFVLKHNPEISPDRVDVAPNSVELKKDAVMNDPGQIKAANYYIRKKYDLPLDTTIFIYGGNLGKPQGIDYLVNCLDANKHRTDCFFVVVGSGTHYNLLSEWYKENKECNVKLMQSLPKSDYDLLVKSCDVGLIFLDHRFSIPNYPSRLLSYLENKMPVLCATDVNTDIGRIAEEDGYGYWCESVNPEDFTALVDKILSSDRKAMGEKGYESLKANYLVEHTYNAIMKRFVIKDI
ncbi:MAG: glycosyltransferase family 4 protein [Bacteroidota bacterium]|nr:glycosyltransferase family 4 protein [Bacteroidota bacterium]